MCIRLITCLGLCSIASASLDTCTNAEGTDECEQAAADPFFIQSKASLEKSPMQHQEKENRNDRKDPISNFAHPTKSKLQDQAQVHWIFTTDCSAYMFNQGNVLLQSALHVGQPGKFTWIMSGCSTEQQKNEMKKLGHPRARVWHSPSPVLIHPKTGQPYQGFQAANRPASIFAWWEATKPSEELIVIVDPDEIWLRPVHFLHAINGEGQNLRRGAFETSAALPGRANAAFYAIGWKICDNWSDGKIENVCGTHAEVCKSMRRKLKDNECRNVYSSGPPWILHRSDAPDIFKVWMNTSILTHELDKSDIFAEQVAYAVSQMQFGFTSITDRNFFVSAPGDVDQHGVWSQIARSSYDPCEARDVPPADEVLPPFLHMCQTARIQHLEKEQFIMHKDHIHKDLLDCDAPLIKYPPRNALKLYEQKFGFEPPEASASPGTHLFQSTATKHKRQAKFDGQWQQTWLVCSYTNAVNRYAGQWKMAFCDKPNLNATYKYPPHGNQFLNPNSRMKHIFDAGGWRDQKTKIWR